MKQGDDRSAQSTARHIVAGEPREETNLVGFHQAAGGRESGAAETRRGDESGRAPKGAGSSGEPGEDELVSRTLAGDDDAFEVLVRRNSSRVFSIIGSFFRRRDMVEDIAQEVFAKAYFSLSTFTLGRSFEAWVAKIAVNACYDHLRSQRRRIEQQIPHESQDEDGWLELQMLEVARDRHASSERQRDAAEIADRLLAKLEPEDRIVIVLMDRDGFSVKEVSEMTGWGQSKVKVRAFRARRVLRAAMKRLVLSGERMQRSKQ
ncbi:MAG TPA: sigma-70 family RNA polymerase sigma factor [Blastocatellia bacterium]